VILAHLPERRFTAVQQVRSHWECPISLSRGRALCCLASDDLRSLDVYTYKKKWLYVEPLDTILTEITGER